MIMHELDAPRINTEVKNKRVVNIEITTTSYIPKPVEVCIRLPW